jgi:hypothetical protein
VNEREAHEKAAFGAISFGHYLLRRTVEEQAERRQIVKELCSAASESGFIETSDVERVLAAHGVAFENRKCLDDIRDFINSI